MRIVLTTFALCLVAAFALADDKQDCVTCHSQETPAAVAQWKQSAHFAAEVSCGDCHYSMGRPERLPGEAAVVRDDASTGTRRRCESCHSLAGTHDWLPEQTRHFKAVTCESCHVPELQMAAQQSIDATVVRLDGTPQTSYRGVTGDLQESGTAYIRGYKPLLRVGTDVHGDNKVLPYNLVTRWFWEDQERKREILDRYRMLDVAVRLESRLAEPILQLSDMRALVKEAEVNTVDLSQRIERAAKSLREWDERLAEDGISLVWLVINNADPLQQAGEYIEDLTSSYVKTLLYWKKNFLSKQKEVKALGFDDNFIRKWDYYLTSCAVGFDAEYIGDAQLLIEKRK